MSDTLEDRLHKAQQADEFLKHPLWKEAVEELRKIYFAQFVGTKPTDDMGRYRLQQACVILDKIESHVVSVSQDGTLARNQLKELERDERSGKLARLFA